MDIFLTVKMIHILAAIVVMGTGTGIAFFMFMANRSNNTQAILVTANSVILGDWLFTTPAVILQLSSGLYLMSYQGYSFSSVWFYSVIGLFLFIGVCWIPVVIIQYKLRMLAKESVVKGEVTIEFKRLMKMWILLGILAFIAIVGVLGLMVFKPFLG